MSVKSGPEDEKVLHDLAGWIGHVIKSSVNGCYICLPPLSDASPSLPQSSFTTARSYGRLNHPSQPLFTLIREAELFVRNANVINRSIDELHFQIKKCANTIWAVVRVIIFWRWQLGNSIFCVLTYDPASLPNSSAWKKQYESKSAAARTTIE